MPKIRVAVVDDSSFVRAALARLIEGDPRFEVVGQASDGPSAITLVERLRPDVVTMDYNMPGMNGDEVVRRILEKVPTPIVMVSAHTQEGAAASVAALAAGAVDVVAKPSGEVSMDLARVSAELLEKLELATRASPKASSPPPARPAARLPESTPPPPSVRGSATLRTAGAAADRIIVIGSSTGGPAALDALMRMLPAMRDSAVLLVQHMGAALTAALATRLDSIASMRVREARDGDRPTSGGVLLAPGDRHLTISPTGAVRLTTDPPVHGVRPAVDVTMRSIATSFGPRAIGVVLTGMGRDGAMGLASIKAAGGRTIAQDQATCVVFGMPKAAIELGVVDEVAPLQAIAAAIGRAMARG